MTVKIWNPRIVHDDPLVLVVQGLPVALPHAENTGQAPVVLVVPLELGHHTNTQISSFDPTRLCLHSESGKRRRSCFTWGKKRDMEQEMWDFSQGSKSKKFWHIVFKSI